MPVCGCSRTAPKGALAVDGQVSPRKASESALSLGVMPPIDEMEACELLGRMPWNTQYSSEDALDFC